VDVNLRLCRNSIRTVQRWQLLAPGELVKEMMDGGGWEDLEEQVCTQLEIGVGKGETELETLTRLIRLERLNFEEAIEKAGAHASDCERELVIRKARVIEWKPPSRSFGPH
jgi:hypothetical protein